MNESLLVNALGHLAGVLLFGIFLVLLLQDRSARRLKPIAAAALALAWNLASLIVLGLPDPNTLFGRCTVAVGFTVLSLLPAVLFDLCLAPRHQGLIRAGYALSLVAVVPHILEISREDAQYHRFALTFITAGFGLLTALAAALEYRERHDRAGASRLVGAMSLFLLAMSFVHFGEGHAEQIWSQELAFHHAGIPLALLVLLQDYRFVLLDAFLRFLANVILAAAFVSVPAIAWQLGWLPAPDTPLQFAILLAGAVFLLIAFAMARAAVQRLLTSLVLRRPNEETLMRNLKSASGAEEWAALIGRYFRAEATISGSASGEAAVPLRDGAIVLGRREGGRRYLSEDLAVLRRASAVIAEQIEERRETEVRRLVSQAELRALQSQIHPHFLFNALNTLYGIIPREARGARDTVLNLADIFRYFLETRRTLVPLEEEMRIVRAYLEIERLRLGDKLQVAIDVAEDALHVAIPILSIQPLVENAIKHGIGPLAGGGHVSVIASVRQGELHVAVGDTGRGFAAKDRTGVGLENVQRRLDLCFGGRARLNIDSSDAGSTVALLIPAAPQAVEAAR